MTYCVSSAIQLKRVLCTSTTFCCFISIRWRSFENEEFDHRNRLMMIMTIILTQNAFSKIRIYLNRGIQKLAPSIEITWHLRCSSDHGTTESVQFLHWIATVSASLRSAKSFSYPKSFLKWIRVRSTRQPFSSATMAQTDTYVQKQVCLLIPKKFCDKWNHNDSSQRRK